MVSTATKLIFFVVLTICITFAVSQPLPQQQQPANPDLLKAILKIPEGVFTSVVGISEVVKQQQDAAKAAQQG